MVTCIESFKSGDFVSTFGVFTGSAAGSEVNEAWVEGLFDSLFTEQVFDYLDVEARFIFANHRGTYTYNSSTKHWAHLSDQTAKAIFNFPSTSTSTSNDMQLVVGSYSDSKISIDGEEVYIPKTASIEMFKAGAEIAHIKLTDLSLEVISPEFSMPTNLSGSIMLAPYTYEFAMERKTRTEFFVSAAVTSTASCGYNAETTVKLKHDDYENLGESDLDNIFFKFGFGSMAIELDADVDGIEALFDNATIADVNSKLNANVKFNDVEIGTLNFYEKTTGETNLNITYKDATSDDIFDAYLEDFFKNLETVFEDYAS